MEAEVQFARFVHGLAYEAVPAEALAVVRRMLLTVLGTGVAGAAEEGCEAVRSFVRTQHAGGPATVFVHGERTCASGAALANGVMCRALDYCDAMAPGLHIGSSLIPAALAVAEVRGGVSGREFITALVVGAETAARLNLSEAAYDGADPTGVAAVFGATAACSRLLRLTPQQTLNALALAFNRAAGSFQSNVDGSLAVRLIQGWVAESGVICAQLAQAGLTGPRHFLSGVYGYAHLFAKGERCADSFVEKLGSDYWLNATMFKKYPSCGLTQGATELALRARAMLALSADDIAQVRVTLPPYAHKLVGHPFVIGDNPRVNGQFSVRYCIANALIRGVPKLGHFCNTSLRDPVVFSLAERVEAVADDGMSEHHHTAVVLYVETVDGRRYDEYLEIAPGFPGNALAEEFHLARFHDCMAYAAQPLSGDQIERLLANVADLHALDDVRILLTDMVSECARAAHR